MSASVSKCGRSLGGGATWRFAIRKCMLSQDTRHVIGGCQKSKYLIRLNVYGYLSKVSS